MILNSYRKNALDYIVVDDIYSEEELKLIKTELIELIPRTLPVDKINSARDENNLYKKDCLSLWADEYYIGDRSKSNILNFNRKLFCEDLTSFAENVNSFFGHINNCDKDSTLINFYKSGEQYKSHRDASMLTAITLVEMGSVNGGGLIFTDFNEFITFKDNRMIIFPGCVEHKTESITTDINSYRVSITQFLNYGPRK
jgi:hypothetical protein